MVPRKQINSIKDIVSSAPLGSRRGEPRVVYRGESKMFAMPCEPKAFRDDTYRKSNQLFMRDPVLSKVTQWKKEVMIAEGKPLIAKNPLEEMIMAQQYGVATRLLDWSLNPLVATWFAVSDQNDQSGYVYATTSLAKHVALEFDSPDMSDQTDEHDDRYIALVANPYNEHRSKKVKFNQVHYFRPSYLPDARAVAQSGVISIHPEPGAFNMAAVDITYEILAENKSTVLHELNTLGINDRSIGLATREYLAAKANKDLL